jgi:disulfide bond formation protein DsbB
VNTAKAYLYGAWAIALGATLGSLVLSDLYHFIPCTLCWYQRILMFPLPVILTIGLYRRDRNVWAYALPLAAAGLAIAGYHSLLQWGIIHELPLPCTSAVPCTVKQLNLLGFITIPFLSAVSFAGIVAGLLGYRATARD